MNSKTIFVVMALMMVLTACTSFSGSTYREFCHEKGFVDFTLVGCYEYGSMKCVGQKSYYPGGGYVINDIEVCYGDQDVRAWAEKYYGN